MANYISVVQTIIDNAGSEMNERIPGVTQANFNQIGQILTSAGNEDLKEKFLNALLYKVAFTDVCNRRWKNPLAVLKTNKRPYGGVKELAHVNPVKGVTYDGAAQDLLTVSKPEVVTAYTKMNRQDKYPVSISNAQLRTAFASETQFGLFYEGIINALYSGDEMDEYILMRDAISQAVFNNKIPTIEVNYPADKNALTKAIKTCARYFKYEKSDFVPYNTITEGTEVVTWTPKERQILLIREDVDVETEVEVLAYAMQMSKVEIETRKIGIDAFTYDTNTLAILCDESFFQFEDQEYTLKGFDNGSNLTTTYWLHHWETIALNPLANAVAFKAAPAEAAAE